ncbi:serine/threonine-protein kinase [Streptomyces populi]
MREVTAQEEFSSPRRATRTLGGRYEVLRELGRGGYGKVSLAYDNRIHRNVAVKEFFSAASEEKRDAAFAEARKAARANSGHSVAVYDIGTEQLPDGSSYHFLVMEYVDGQTLSQVLQRSLYTPAQAAALGIAVLEALAAAHARGVIHRDVKPSNILIADNGRIMLSDFGIARLADDSNSTDRGRGTLGYIAPEVFEPTPAYTPASDLWALGATLYKAVSGKMAYPEYSVLSPDAQHDSLTEAGPLGEAINRLLIRDPKQRIQADELQILLTAAAAATPSTTSEGPAPIKRTRRRFWVAAVGALVLLAAGVIVYIENKPNPSSPYKRVELLSELGPINGSMEVPNGAIARTRNGPADKSPEAKFDKPPFLIELRRRAGSKIDALPEAEQTIAHWKKSHPDASGESRSLAWKGFQAATADITYDETDGTPMLLKEMFVVSGSGDSYRLQVSMPANQPQRAQGEKYFDTALKSLNLRDLHN